MMAASRHWKNREGNFLRLFPRESTKGRISHSCLLEKLRAFLSAKEQLNGSWIMSLHISISFQVPPVQGDDAGWPAGRASAPARARHPFLRSPTSGRQADPISQINAACGNVGCGGDPGSSSGSEPAQCRAHRQQGGS